MTFLIPQRIETARLHLRMFTEADWEPLCQIFRDEECVRYTTTIPLTDWQTWRWMAGYLGHWHLRGYGPYAVIEKQSGRMIGPVGLWYPGDWPEPEIKWSIVREFWGHGYATEAASAVLDMSTRTLKRSRLISLILPDNERSKAVARRLGGEYEKTISFRDGKADIFAYRLGEQEQAAQ
jgi:RimJ/RimL family protein N-acetyltransferase